MKRCTRCNFPKDISEFNHNKAKKDGRQSYCRSCGKSSSRRYYEVNSQRMREQIAEAKQRRIEQNQDFILRYLTDNPCVDCGERDPLVLEFDHVRGNKINNVSVLVRMCCLAVVQAEVAKCEVRCANCHRRKTAFQNGSWLTKRVDSTNGSARAS